jgi:hypothetical protein
VADVFISYAREDKDIAARLAYVLENQEGWTCWWDPRIDLGEDFRSLVIDQIDTSAVSVVIWTPASRASNWVAWEVARARTTGALVEVVVGDALRLPPGDEPLVVPPRLHLPPARDEIVARVAQAGSLTRRRELWNSRLQLTAWRDRPPRRPIIAWEFVDVETPNPRLVRRERWTDTSSVAFGTSIGNVWLIGQEGAVVAIGYITISQHEHRVRVPKHQGSVDRRFRARHPALAGRTIPFSLNVSLAERAWAGGEFTYPGGGVDLGATEEPEE